MEDLGAGWCWCGKGGGVERGTHIEGVVNRVVV